jgi:hypothetical protein
VCGKGSYIEVDVLIILGHFIAVGFQPHHHGGYDKQHRGVVHRAPAPAIFTTQDSSHRIYHHGFTAPLRWEDESYDETGSVLYSDSG